jgi:hypothetical protein
MPEPKPRPATGKLGVLLPGMGAVGTTFMAGSLLVRKGLGRPIGSLTQMGTLRLGKRTDQRSPLIRDFVPLADMDDLVFGGWDLFSDNAYEAAVTADVLSTEHLNAVWCGSTEVYREPTEVHGSLSQFEEGLRRSDPAISPSQVYAYACLREELMTHLGREYYD